MKSTTEYDVRALINEATANLRADLTETLIELAATANVRREQDIAATAQLVDSTADYLKKYVRDLLANRPSVAEAVGGPQFYRSNEWLEKQESYKLGHAVALSKVRLLLRDALDSKPSIELFKKAVEGLSL